MKKKILYTLTAALAAAATHLAGQEISPPALASLVEAERAFAKTSVEKGVRESFLMFFADDGINFQPGPVVTKQAFLKQPAPPLRPPVTLNWAPVFGDVAAAGDLGFTTGPFQFSDDEHKQPPRFGFYFSVWKKQPDGIWKVVIDAGVSTPTLGVPLNSAFRPADRVRSAKRVEMTSIEAGRASLVEADRRLLEAAKSEGLGTAMSENATDDSRVHRSGRLPIIGKQSIRSYFSEKPYAILWEPIRADVSTSGDLGYTHGTYEMKNDLSQAQPAEKGYYVRVWVRSGESKWGMALDTTIPTPAGQ
jgi:ketosteroid isomerase-like protein